MRSRCLIILFWSVLATSPAAELADNAELQKIYDADQKDREAPVGGIDWKVVGPRDLERRNRVRELLGRGAITTGKDFERAALVYQHGDSADEILFAHVLAVTALGKGNPQARWLAAATLDRYLHRIGQPQVFGTQFTNKNVGELAGWTMEPYNRDLLMPSLIEANCVPDRGHQEEMVKAIRQGQEPPEPKRKPCSSAQPKP